MFLNEGTASKAEPSVWRLPGARHLERCWQQSPSRSRSYRLPAHPPPMSRERRAQTVGSLRGDSKFPPQQTAPSLYPHLFLARSLLLYVMEEKSTLLSRILNLPKSLSLWVSYPFCIKSSTFLFLWAFPSYVKRE